MSDNINTHYLDAMLSGAFHYWIAGGCYDIKEREETLDMITKTFAERNLDPKDFELNYFMDHIIVSKKGL
jgi:hypothetical protein